jgi:multidrug resistance protein
MRTQQDRNSRDHSVHDDLLIKDEDVLKATEVEAQVAVPAPETAIPYTVFTRAERRMITRLIGCSMFFSPFTPNIYFPCLEEIEHAVGVSTSLINLTITTYLIVQAIAPAFYGDLADNLGRRPVYLVTFGIYVCANLGLALQQNYAALMVLRARQSFGCSATVAIGYGVIADVATPATRGSILGPAVIATNLGPSIGPLVGGVMAARAGFRWVFWLLVIVGVAFLALLGLVFPKTGRKVVGNGSVVAPKWNRPLLQSSRQRKLIATGEQRPWNKRSLIPNPFKALLVCFHRDTAMVLSISAVYYAAYYHVQASIPAIFTQVYGLDELEVGLCYFSIGTGVILGGYINGKLMDYNYRSTAKANNITIDKVVGDDVAKFPIEKARSRMSWLLMPTSTAVIVGYGWVLRKELVWRSLYSLIRKTNNMAAYKRTARIIVLAWVSCHMHMSGKQSYFAWLRQWHS